MKKLRIDIGILLPEVPDEQDACVQRIIHTMQLHKGVANAHIKGAGREAQLCLHYDPDVISIARLQALAREAGAAITTAFGHLLVEVGPFRELNEASGVEHELRTLQGIVDASVSATGIIRIEFDQTAINQDQILRILERDRPGPVAGEHIMAGRGGVAVQEREQDQDHDHSTHPDVHDHNHDHDTLSFGEHGGHNHGGGGAGSFKVYLPVIVSLCMLLVGIGADHLVRSAFFSGWLRLAWYGIAYLPVGLPVAMQGLRLLVRGDVFTEFVLMSLATIGAFCIGEYPEAVAVMLFYNVGELFQDAAVNRAKRSIKALLDIRPAVASLRRNDTFTDVKPRDVQVGDIIQIRAGEKVPLDGELLSGSGTFNTAALTGESKPTEFLQGGMVLAGMINLGRVVELRVTKRYEDSSLARILTLVQEATTRKARTEQFIRKFSRVYTPIVVMLAVLITLLPYFFVNGYIFRDWLYRALIFLVISCPCALVISIPLGYFGGIGAASRNGILFKGSNFLDLMTGVNAVVLDKTGTLTKGVFKVREVTSYGMDERDWLPLAGALEAGSTHPVAQAVVAYVGAAAASVKVEHQEEISGHGIRGSIGGMQVLAGNLKLMHNMNIEVPDSLAAVTDTIVVIAVDGRLAGHLRIADEIREDSAAAIGALNRSGIRTVMLSGDKQAVVDRVAKELGIGEAYGDLLPEDKVRKVEAIKADKSRIVAFVGDGINDAPVLALSDVGIAMGGLGSDAAIETADVIIQTDQPSRIFRAIRIGRATNRVVWQNIIFAFAVKAIVLALGAGGLATMWEAVFADVGVALLAVLNAMRIQRMNFA